MCASALGTADAQALSTASHHHGAHAQQGQGQEPLISAVQAVAGIMAEDHHDRGVADGCRRSRELRLRRKDCLQELRTQVPKTCAAVQVEENITKLAKKGLTPSAIGVILRDQHGIAQVRQVLWLL